MTEAHSAAQTIGSVLARVQSTDSPPPCEKHQIELRDIAMPATVEEARALREWAETQPKAWPPIETAQLARHLQFMTATLPAKNLDEEGGRKRVAVYSRILGGYSDQAIAHLALVACSTLEWFPTPSQCLAILAAYSDAPTPRDRALAACHGFAQRQFETFRAALKDGQGTADLLDGVPDQWKRICVEQGFLRWSKDDGFVIDRRYQAAATAAGSEGEA